MAKRIGRKMAAGGGIGVGRRRGRKSALSLASYEALRAELARREEQVGAMMRRREELAAEIEAIDREIGTVGASQGMITVRRGPGRPRGSGMSLPARAAGPRRGRGGKRPRNSTNLVEALKGVLTNHVLSVTDAVEAVQKAGYLTTSPNFRTIVNQALLANKNVFKKVARGQYTAK